jgi:glutamate-5-semialdehyde dehydrogenase
MGNPGGDALALGLAQRARHAARGIATASTEKKNAVLLELARRIRTQEDRILQANSNDLEHAESNGLSDALIDRLRLTPTRIESMAAGVESIATLTDPVGRIEDRQVRPNGLQIARMRIPLGVICIIYESRPNVTIDAGALCLKSGNAPILKGGKEAHHSNGVLVELMQESLAHEGLDPNVVQAIATSDRSVIANLIRQDRFVDLVIPRGGEGLIRYITENATVPVIQHYKGVCHVYVDAEADLKMAEEIAFNAKVHRPGVCNAMETLLVHRDIARDLVPILFLRYQEAGVELRVDSRLRALWPQAQAATEDDWEAEFLSLTLAVRMIDDADAAMRHIDQYGSGHTESIVTNNKALGERFIHEVSSSCVLHNASTRFNDGGELGLGAEIGISTSKLHAYGPMGLEELTTRKFVVYGTGQIRP